MNEKWEEGKKNIKIQSIDEIYRQYFACLFVCREKIIVNIRREANK